MVHLQAVGLPHRSFWTSINGRSTLFFIWKTVFKQNKSGCFMENEGEKMQQLWNGMRKKRTCMKRFITLAFFFLFFFMCAVELLSAWDLTIDLVYVLWTERNHYKTCFRLLSFKNCSLSLSLSHPINKWEAFFKKITTEIKNWSESNVIEISVLCLWIGPKVFKIAKVKASNVSGLTTTKKKTFLLRGRRTNEKKNYNEKYRMRECHPHRDVTNTKALSAHTVNISR